MYKNNLFKDNAVDYKYNDIDKTLTSDVLSEINVNIMNKVKFELITNDIQYKAFLNKMVGNISKCLKMRQNSLKSVTRTSERAYASEINKLFQNASNLFKILSKLI